MTIDLYGGEHLVKYKITLHKENKVRINEDHGPLAVSLCLPLQAGRMQTIDSTSRHAAPQSRMRSR